VIAHAAAVYAIVVAASLAAAIAGCCAAWGWRAQALRDRLALRLARQREAAFVEAARRLADAAGKSVVAVREEMERAVRVIAPGIDAVMFFEEFDAQLTCVAATGARVAYFGGLRFALDDDTSLLVRALRSGHRTRRTRHASASSRRCVCGGDPAGARCRTALRAVRRRR